MNVSLVLLFEPRVQGVVATVPVNEPFRVNHTVMAAVPGGARIGGRPWPGPWDFAAEGPQRLRGQGRPQAAAAGGAEQP